MNTVKQTDRCAARLHTIITEHKVVLSRTNRKLSVTSQRMPPLHDGSKGAGLQLRHHLSILKIMLAAAGKL